MTEQKTINEALSAQLDKWIADLQLVDGEKADFQIASPKRIDPEKGTLTQAFVIEVTRQMERVDSEPHKVEPLPPIPSMEK